MRNWKAELVAHVGFSVLLIIINIIVSLSTRHCSDLNNYEREVAHHIIDPSHITEQMDTIGGLQDIKQNLRVEVLLPLKYPKLFFSRACEHMRPPKGILLHGPPGVGKTMIAKAIAAEANVPFISLALSALENKYFGEANKLIAATFSLARKRQPCVLFFDEIDGMMRTRSDADQSCVYGFKTEFLSQMDGMNTSSSDAIVIIACTNCVERLDPAVRRRLTKQYHVTYPRKEEMLTIFALALGARTSITKKQLRSVVKKIRSPCSGSDIASVVKNAWSSMVRDRLSSCDARRMFVDYETTPQELSDFVGDLDVTYLVDELQRVGLYTA